MVALVFKNYKINPTNTTPIKFKNLQKTPKILVILPSQLSYPLYKLLNYFTFNYIWQSLKKVIF